jgi:hypothetical protein
LSSGKPSACESRWRTVEPGRLIALTDLHPEATGPRGPRFGGRLARLDSLEGRRRQAELADLLGIAKAGAGNGDFTPGFSAAAVHVLRPLA